MSFTSLGGIGGSNYNYYNDILEFKPSTGTWSRVGRMLSARNDHAVSIISTADVIDYC